MRGAVGLLLRYSFQGPSLPSSSIDDTDSTTQELAVTLSRYPNAVAVHLETEVSKSASVAEIDLRGNLDDRSIPNNLISVSRSIIES